MKPQALCLLANDLADVLRHPAINLEFGVGFRALTLQQADLLINLLAARREQFYFAPRRDIENDPSKLQPIGYTLVLTSDNKALVYNRPNKTGEQRLAGAASIGFGGHVEIPDWVNQLVPADYGNFRFVMENSIHRELREELSLLQRADFETGTVQQNSAELGYGEPQLIGVILSDATETDKVHMGFVYTVRLFEPVDEHWRADISARAADEVINLRQVPLSELTLVEGLESWSQLIVDGVYK